MNGKQAKRLRREARAMTAGMPDVEYLKQPTMYPNRHIIVLGNCTRKAYKLLKRNYKNQ